jgi:hypothetical protein
MNMEQIIITGANLGDVISTKGVLDKLVMAKVPPARGYSEYFTLVNVVKDHEIVIFNFDPSTSGMADDAVLLSNGGIHFENLKVKDVPPGSVFAVEVQELWSDDMMMSNSTLEIVAGDHQISETSGAVGALSIHIAGGRDGWIVADSIGPPISEAIIWAATHDSPFAAGGAVVRFDFPLNNGLWLRVPQDGVCSLSWDKV